MLAGETRCAGCREQDVAPIFHDRHRELDRVTHVAQARRPTGAQVRTYHHAGIQLDLAVAVETGADPGVEKGLVLHVTDRSHGCRERAISNSRPTGIARAV